MADKLKWKKEGDSYLLSGKHKWCLWKSGFYKKFVLVMDRITIEHFRTLKAAKAVAQAIETG